MAAMRSSMRMVPRARTHSLALALPAARLRAGWHDAKSNLSILFCFRRKFANRIVEANSSASGLIFRKIFKGEPAKPAKVGSGRTCVWRGQCAALKGQCYRLAQAGCVQPNHHGYSPSVAKGGSRLITAWCSTCHCPWATTLVLSPSFMFVRARAIGWT